jgi:hypothetical protein
LVIVGAVAGALFIAGVGASAHTALFVTKSSGLHSSVSDDETSGARTEPAESPEPTQTPEAQPTAEPAEQPEPADNDTDTDENNDDDNHDAAPATTGDHESGDHGDGGGGDGEHGD